MSVNEGAGSDSSSRRHRDESNLPDWLRDVEIEIEGDDDASWASDVDFSNLPGWLAPDASDEADDFAVPEWLDEPAGDSDVEPEGSGLLADVRGPIPVEPIISLPHEAPPFPGSRSTAPTTISPGASAPVPVRTTVQPAETGRLRGTPLLRFVLVVLLILAILATVALIAIPDVLDLLQIIPLIGIQFYG